LADTSSIHYSGVGEAVGTVVGGVVGADVGAAVGADTGLTAGAANTAVGRLTARRIGATQAAEVAMSRLLGPRLSAASAALSSSMARLCKASSSLSLFDRSDFLTTLRFFADFMSVFDGRSEPCFFTVSPKALTAERTDVDTLLQTLSRNGIRTGEIPFLSR